MNTMREMAAPHALLEVEASGPPAAIALADGDGGAHVLVRFRGRPVGAFWISRSKDGPALDAAAVARRIETAAGPAIAAEALTVDLDACAGRAGRAPTPSMTIALCTRGRPHLVRRCLAALTAARAAAPEPGVIDILVVDNAPSGNGTRDAAAAFDGVRYAVEPVPGLDFGRNRALAGTDRPWIAYVDDDAVIDGGWLDAFAAAVRASPDAACFTGPILPLTLETEAQRRFERSGGFGKGFRWERYGRMRWGDPIYPASAGRLGTGANMIFAAAALRAAGGFDEALDTGHPLPGGGDIDAFYNIVRSGGRLIYEPALLVLHEHRADMAGLRRQYHSWGLSILTLAAKQMAADPEMRSQHRRLAQWWLGNHARRLLKALIGRGALPPSHVAAEIVGGLQGACGEYARSQRRVAGRKKEYGA